MPLHPNTILVLPNPYRSIDGEGRPCGVCSCDPDVFGRRWIGGKINEAATSATVQRVKSAQKREMAMSLVAPQQSVIWEFSSEPVAVTFTGDARYFIMKKLRTGELLAADRASADAAGIPFVEPAQAAAQTKAAAREQFDAAHGAGSFDMLAKERGEATDTPEPLAETTADPEPDKSKRSGKTTPKG